LEVLRVGWSREKFAGEKFVGEMMVEENFF
jgi:hypothetical protein